MEAEEPMIAVDTNVVVRILAADEPRQLRTAADLFAREQVLVQHTVLLEAEWVLRRAYRLTRDQIANAFTRLLGMPTVSLNDAEMVRGAIEAFVRGCDFGDALHVSMATGATEFVTFDRDFGRQARAQSLIPRVRVL